MKRIKLPKTLIVIITGVLVVVTLSLIIGLLGKEKLGESSYAILLEIDKAFIVTVIIGTIVKLISNEILEVKRNDSKMRELGIHTIGEGKLDHKQTHVMFGGHGYEYPAELKFLFISGDNFIKTFEKKIIDAIKNGTNVKILIADPISSNDFLLRAEELCPQSKEEGHYSKQVYRTSSYVKTIMEECKDYEGSIEIRHYKDEYRYNYRLALYGNPINTYKVWANFQPQTKDSIDLSLCVIGTYDKEYVKNEKSVYSKESNSLVLSLNDSFDLLWEKYKKTSNAYIDKNFEE